MRSRRSPVAFIALLALGLSGCAATPAPEPSPSATGFASEEEAFAAAEETYRAYVAEINAYNAGDDDADPLRYLQGELRDTDEQIYEQTRAAGVTTEGDLKITDLRRDSVELVAGAASVQLDVCMDASEWRFINADGEDVTPTDAPKKYFLDVELATVDRSRLVIIGNVPDFESDRC
ncbi:hypothetical protein [Microbacterium sp. JZ31]|uniref:hypothetical protein n=1 Tax=Microbacterium sp. JZ31 TaxID=1906274 RepID=UPI0019345537|nr:hypothetical protein [Microbacterium sp. JZ31]